MNHLVVNNKMLRSVHLFLILEFFIQTFLSICTSCYTKWTLTYSNQLMSYSNTLHINYKHGSRGGGLIHSGSTCKFQTYSIHILVKLLKIGLRHPGKQTYSCTK